jgi:hypothetical protein
MGALNEYRRFESSNPKLNFSFLYPADWQVKEIEEKTYSEAFVRGPRNRADTLSVGITVTVVPTREAGGEFATVEEALADYMARSQRLADWRELSRTNGSFLSSPAVEMTISYTLRLPLNSPLAQATSIVERKLIVKHGSHLYKITYRAIEEDYYAFLPAFRDVVRTLEFRDERTEVREFYPLITPLPAPAVREQGAGYKAHETE